MVKLKQSNQRGSQPCQNGNVKQLAKPAVRRVARMVNLYNIQVKTNLDVLQLNKALADIQKLANRQNKEFRVEMIMKQEGEDEMDSD